MLEKHRAWLYRASVLHGIYGVREGIDHYTKTWSKQKPSFKKDYAERAMQVSNRQFHDVHTKCKKMVLDTLEEVVAEVDDIDGECPFCEKPYDSTRPPYGLVGRLDRASRAYKNALTDLTSKTKRKKQQINVGGYTSSRVKTYFKDK